MPLIFRWPHLRTMQNFKCSEGDANRFFKLGFFKSTSKIHHYTQDLSQFTYICTIRSALQMPGWCIYLNRKTKCGMLDPSCTVSVMLWRGGDFKLAVWMSCTCIVYMSFGTQHKICPSYQWWWCMLVHKKPQIIIRFYVSLLSVVLPLLRVLMWNLRKALRSLYKTHHNQTWFMFLRWITTFVRCFG